MVNYRYKNEKLKREFIATVDDLRKLFSDREIRLILFWIIIGPLCALAYLIWSKYERFRLIALVLFVFSLIYFIGQIGGLWYVLSRLFG